MNVAAKVLLICFVLIAPRALCIEVQGLFEAEVMTQSQSYEDRNAAIKAALKIVLGKILTGQDILQDSAVQIALADAGRYVTRYQYSLIPSGIDKNSTARVMRVEFDEEALLELMQSSKLGIWSEIRDETLLWLVVDDSGKRQFFNADIMPDIANALHKSAKRKGLPLLLPLLDLQEQQQISVNDVLSAYSDRLMKVSQRYATASVLSGRIEHKENCWRSEWTLYFNHTVKQWPQKCTTLDKTLLSGLQGTYDKLSSYFAVKPETLAIDTVLLRISGIHGMTDMTRVTDYLTGLPIIESVGWIKVESGANLYKVKYKGKRRVFEEMLGLGRVLDPVNRGSEKQDELEFRLLKEQ